MDTAINLRQSCEEVDAITYLDEVLHIGNLHRSLFYVLYVF